MWRICCCRERTISGSVSLPILCSTSVANSDGAESFTTAHSLDDELLEPATFDNLNEFLTCDASVKHRTPISMSEFKLLTELMEESPSMWSFAARTPAIEVQQKMDKSSPCVLIRCFCEYDDVAPLAFLYNLVEAESRATWDNMFTDFRVIESIGEGSDVVYLVLPSPALAVAARDFVLHRRIAIENTLEGKRYSIIQRSALHASMPETRGMVRAENIIGGYSVFQKSGSSKTSLFVTTMSDPKGRVPSWAVNAMASKKLVSWVDRLYRACKESKDIEMLESWAHKYNNV